MPKKNCFSARPGSIFNYKGESYKILENDTLSCTIHAVPIDSFRKKHIQIPYHPGQEIFLRWVPDNRKD